MNRLIRIELTDDQKLKLKPIFDAVTAAHDKSADNRDLRGGIHGQAFENGGYAEFRFFDHEQTKIVRAAIEDAMKIDEYKEAQDRLVEIKNKLALLTKERDEINAHLAKTQKPRAKKKKR